jgi:hypothetical protein
MDDDTRTHLEAMEARLMARINDSQEKLLERMRINETAVAALTEVIHGTNNTLATITTLLTIIANPDFPHRNGAPEGMRG